MFGGMGAMEILLIFLVALLLFGARRLPEIGSSLGKGIREFKGSLREIENELKVPEDRREHERQVRRPESRTEPEGGPRRLTAESVPPADSGPEPAPSAASAGPSSEEDEGEER